MIKFKKMEGQCHQVIFDAEIECECGYSTDLVCIEFSNYFFAWAFFKLLGLSENFKKISMKEMFASQIKKENKYYGSEV